MRQLRKIAVFIVGMSVLLFGIALIVLPGPAFIVIPAGLSILALEFAWARRWIKKARETAGSAGEKFKNVFKHS
jgi:tellurite resistance protein TerC